MSEMYRNYGIELMNYSPCDFERMKTDPVLRRQYFWKVGNAALVRSHDAQNPDSRRDRELADYVLANLDRLVASGKTMDALDDFD